MFKMIKMPFFNLDSGAGQGGANAMPSLLEQFPNLVLEDDGSDGEPIPTPEGYPPGAGNSEQPPAEAIAELFDIIHNGQTHQLSREDMIKQAQQGFDYTQKTQKLAEQQKGLEHLTQLDAFLSQNPELANAITSQIEAYINGGQAPMAQEQMQPDPMAQLQAQYQQQFAQMQSELENLRNYQAMQLYEKDFNDLASKYPDANDQKQQIESLLAQKAGITPEEAYWLLNKDTLLQKEKERMVEQNKKKQFSKTETKSLGAGNGADAPAKGTWEAARAAMLEAGNRLFTD